jgi:predicted nucleic acid-binding protein
MRVYLDNCCLNRPYDDKTFPVARMEAEAKLFIQRLIQENKIELVISFMSLKENDDNPYIERKINISNFFPYVCCIIDETFVESAIQISNQISRDGIKNKDALHVACAIIAKCNYFITTDKRLLKLENKAIVLINPIQFIAIWGENNG